MTRHQATLSCAALLVVACCCTDAFAYRPFDGTDADVAPLGEAELEMSPVAFRQEGSARFLVAPALVANLGFAVGLEAVLEGRNDIPLNAGRPRTEVDDVAFSIKALLRRGALQGRDGLSIAMESGVLLPGSEARAGAHVASIFSLAWPALALHLNLGNDLLTSLAYRANVSLIVEGPATWRVRPVGELLAQHEFGREAPARQLDESLLFGGIGRWSDALSFDAAVLVGRTHASRALEGRLGLTWAFEAW